MVYFNKSKMLIKDGVMASVLLIGTVKEPVTDENNVVLKNRNNVIYLLCKPHRGVHLHTQLPGIHDIKPAW